MPSNATRMQFYTDQIGRYLKEYPGDPAKRAKFMAAKHGKVEEIGRYLGAEPVAGDFKGTLERYHRRLNELSVVQSEIRHSLANVMDALRGARSELDESLTASGYAKARDFLAQVKKLLFETRGGEAKDALKLELKDLVNIFKEHGVLSEADGKQISGADAKSLVAVMLGALERYQRLIDSARSAHSLAEVEAMRELSKGVSQRGLRTVLGAVAKRQNVQVSAAMTNGDIFAALKKSVPKEAQHEGEIHALLQDVLEPIAEAKMESDAALTTVLYQDVMDIFSHAKEQLSESKVPPKKLKRQLARELKRVTDLLAKQGILSKESGDKIKNRDVVGGLDVLLRVVEHYRRLVDKADKVESESDIAALQEFSKGITHDGLRSVLVALAKRRNVQIDTEDNNATIFHELKKSFRPEEVTELIDSSKRDLNLGILTNDFKALQATIKNLLDADVDNIYMKNALVELLPYAQKKLPDGWLKWKKKLSEISGHVQKKPLDGGKLKNGLVNMALLLDNLHKMGVDAQLNAVLNKLKESRSPDEFIARLETLRQAPLTVDALGHKNLQATLELLRKEANKLIRTDELRSQLSDIYELFEQDAAVNPLVRLKDMKTGIAQLHELMAAARQTEVDFKQNERLVDILNKAQAIKVLNPELVELMMRIKPDERDIKTKLYRSVVNHLIKVVSAASKPGDKRRELQRIEKQFKSREAKYHIDAMRQLARLSQKRMSEVDASLLKKAATFKFQENSKKDNKEYSYSPTRPDYDTTTRSPDKKHKYSKKEDKEDSYSPTRPDYDGTARTPDKNHVLELYDEIKALPNKAPEQLAEFYNERANVALEYVNQMLDPRLSREDKLHIVQDVKEMYENEQLGVPQNLSKLTSNMQTADNQEEILKGIAAVSKDLRKHLNPPRRNIDKLADMLRQMEN